MIIETKDQRRVWLRQYQPGDLDALLTYLQGLSEASRRRFGPHPFDRESIRQFYEQPEHRAYLALSTEGVVVAYAIIRSGFLPHDSPRLQAYGLALDATTDCTFAPSVADAWQGAGLGKALFHYLLTDLQSAGFRRMILWGGVQGDNEQALRYYRQLGFEALGEFEYYGRNIDMARSIG